MPSKPAAPPSPSTLPVSGPRQSLESAAGSRAPAGVYRSRVARWDHLAATLEEAGRLAIARLGPASGARDGSASGPVATPTLAPPRHSSSLIRIARASLPGDIHGGLGRVQRLLRLEDPFLSSDPRSPEARQRLAELLIRTGQDVLGTGEVRYLAADETPNDSPPRIPALAAEALHNPDALYYVPDLASHSAAGATSGPRSGALVLAAVVTRRGEVLGQLEISSRERDPFRDEDLALIALLSDSFADLVERTARIEKLVFVDPMTTVYNRAYFELQVENEMARARRESSSMALCIVDIDDFKLFNSVFGYDGGNEVLIQVAQGLKRAVRPFDTVARWGGEEFAVILTAPVQPQDVLTVCERLRALVDRNEIEISGLDGTPRRVRVTVSIGVAVFPDHERNPGDLWKAANRALLEAKRGTKNQVVFFRPASQSH